MKFSKGLLRSFPLVTPIRHLEATIPWPSWRSSPPPRSQAAPDSPAQARHGLEKVQNQDDDSEPKERPPRLPSARDEIGPAGADRCLRNRKHNRDEQDRSDHDRGTPAEAEQEHPREEGDHQVPLRGESHGPARIARFVQGLERRRAPDALVHAPVHRREIERDAPPVKASAPAQLPDRIVASRPLVFQQGLGSSVPDLLLPELPDRFAAGVPDDRPPRIAAGAPPVAGAPATRRGNARRSE